MSACLNPTTATCCCSTLTCRGSLHRAEVLVQAEQAPGRMYWARFTPDPNEARSGSRSASTTHSRTSTLRSKNSQRSALAFQKPEMNVAFIGSGNLAWHLAPALDNLGHVVKEFYSRNAKHAADLTGRLYQAEVKKSLDFSSSTSNIFFIAVSDDAISCIAQELVLPDNAILVHTSGSQPLSVLEFAATERTGVFYPLQTFSKGAKAVFKEIPLLIECNDPFTEKALM